MKNEFKIFFSKKFILISLVILIPVALLSWYSSMKVSDYSNQDVYAHFIEDISLYDSQEELNDLYQQAVKGELQIPGMVITQDSNKVAFKKLVYEFLLKHELPYDSLVTYSSQLKYNQFYYLTAFFSSFSLIIFLLCVFIGSFYHTSDMMSKMSKLIYTSGEKRTKIIDRKYFISLISIIGIVVAVDLIMSLFALTVSNTGAVYLVLFDGNNLFSLNYFQFVLIMLTSHIFFVFTLYTFVYYVSAIIKNGIITICSMMSIIILLTYFSDNLSYSTRMLLAMTTQGGFYNFFGINGGNVTDFSDLFLMIPVMLIPIAILLISRPFIKRADYSR